jgi:hypothetical protein
VSAVQTSTPFSKKSSDDAVLWLALLEGKPSDDASAQDGVVPDAS